MADIGKLINFSNKNLKTTICSSSLTVDGYEVDNLINGSITSFHRPNSFMCESYMKCPVDIIISFPCLINISHVVIKPKLCGHRSKCIELYTLFQKPVAPDKLKIKQKISHLTNEDFYPCVFDKDFSDSKVRETHKDWFHLVGRYSERTGMEKTADKIIFINHSHSMSNNYWGADCLSLNLKSLPSTKSCAYMLIKIKWATLPVLKSLEVWGTPSNINPRSFVGHIAKLLASSITKTAVEQNTCMVIEKSSEVAMSNEESNARNDTPTEFIDPITFSIMTVPILLPSGNSVDQQTLEKYIAEEEKYGRLPSDPFTGVVFHGSKKPIPNSSLKARVDEYLLKNATRFDLDGLTTGYRSRHSVKTVHLISSNKYKGDAQIAGSSDNIKKPSDFTSSNGCKRKLPYLSEAPVSKGKCKLASDVNVNLEEHSVLKDSHNINMKNSLDLSLAKVLPNLPVLSTSNRPNITKCCNCDESEFRNLFELPCVHIYCRKCLQLILQDGKKCMNCHLKFERNDVKKFVGIS